MGLNDSHQREQMFLMIGIFFSESKVATAQPRRRIRTAFKSMSMLFNPCTTSRTYCRRFARPTVPHKWLCNHMKHIHFSWRIHTTSHTKSLTKSPDTSQNE